MAKARKVKLGEVVENKDGTRTYRVLVGRTQHGRVTVGATVLQDGTVFLSDEESTAALMLARKAFNDAQEGP